MNFKDNFKKEIDDIQVDENIKKNIFNNLTAQFENSEEQKIYPATVKNRRNIFQSLAGVAVCLAVVIGSVFVINKAPWDKEDEGKGALSEVTTTSEVTTETSVTTAPENPVKTSNITPRELFVYDGNWNSIIDLDVPEIPDVSFQVTPHFLLADNQVIMGGYPIVSILIGDSNFDNIPEMYLTSAIQFDYGSKTLIYDFATEKLYSAEGLAFSIDDKKAYGNIIVSQLPDGLIPYEIPEDKILAEGTVFYDETEHFVFMKFGENDYTKTFYLSDEVYNSEYNDLLIPRINDFSEITFNSDLMSEFTMPKERLIEKYGDPIIVDTNYSFYDLLTLNFENGYGYYNFAINENTYQGLVRMDGVAFEALFPDENIGISIDDLAEKHGFTVLYKNGFDEMNGYIYCQLYKDEYLFTFVNTDNNKINENTFIDKIQYDAYFLIHDTEISAESFGASQVTAFSKGDVFAVPNEMTVREFLNDAIVKDIAEYRSDQFYIIENGEEVPESSIITDNMEVAMRSFPLDSQETSTIIYYSDLLQNPN